jgi:iduronate 2-sulfatase
VLDALERSGVANRTLVVFVGDHGYHIGEHGQWGKTSNFELDARVPLMIAPPANPQAGRKTMAFAELIDLFPTLVEWCGLPAAKGLEGTSLVPLIRDPARAVKPAAFTQHPRPAYFDREPGKTPQAMGCSVRTARVRYTEWRDWKTGATIGRELYAEADEPAETQNRIDDSNLAAAQREAETLLRARFPVVKH